MTEPGFLSRTRASYDTVAVDYAEWVRGELDARPLDRALLAGFAEYVRAADAGPVADIGCGPGRVAAYLRDLGLSVFGLDLSPRMIDVARRTYPELRFDVASMTDTGLADRCLGGIVAWYSIIHMPRERLPEVFAEFRRVLRPGGYVQLAFQVGDELLHLERAKGHEVSLDFHRLRPDRVAELLRQAGLDVCARVLREPENVAGFPESTPQGFLLARKPAAPDGRSAS